MEREEIEPDVDRAIDELESGHREMEERSEELGDRVDAARNEWHARQSDSQVPGAVAPEEEEEPSGDAEDEPSDDAEDERSDDTEEEPPDAEESDAS